MALLTLVASGAWRWSLVLAGALLVLGGAYAKGRYDGAIHERSVVAARQAAAAAHIAQLQAKADQLSAALAAGAAKRQAEIRTVTQTLIEKVPVYVTAKADADCSVPRGFVRLHDAASAGRLPPTASAAADTDDPSGIPLSAVGRTVAKNYGACIEWHDRLMAWQAWWEAQRAIRRGR